MLLFTVNLSNFFLETCAVRTYILLRPEAKLKVFYGKIRANFFRLVSVALGAHKPEIKYFFSDLSAMGKCIPYGTVKYIAHEALGANNYFN